MKKIFILLLVLLLIATSLNVSAKRLIEGYGNFKPVANTSFKTPKTVKAVLHDAGVQIIVCGQTVEFRGYKRDEILDFVDVSLSAINALISLQSQGYQLITFN